METHTPNRRLDSWKEIADYLGRDVRTVIRWEKEKKLPVYRIPGGKRAAVYSYSREIDQWMMGQPDARNRTSFRESSPASPGFDGPLQSAQEVVRPALVIPAARRLSFRLSLLFLAAFVLVVIGAVLWWGGQESSAASPLPLERPLRFARADYGAQSPRGLAVADFNGDKKLDLVFTDDVSGTITVLLGDGYGAFPQRVVSPTHGKIPERVVIGDFNEDGRPDVALTSYVEGSEIEVLLGKGDGSFQPVFHAEVGGRARWIATGDLNRDGRLDLVVAGSTAGRLFVFLGDGDGRFHGGGSYEAERDVAALALADFNQDGWLDVAADDYRSAGGRTVSVYFNRGDGTLLPRQQFNSGRGPLGLVTADLNNDGWPDLVTANFPETISVLLSNRSGGFQAPSVAEAGRGNGFAEVADLDRDGMLDLIVLGEHSNTLSILRTGPRGSLQPTESLATGEYPDAAVVGDFDGDHKPDLAVANIDGKSVSVFLNRSPEASPGLLRRLARLYPTRPN